MARSKAFSVALSSILALVGTGASAQTASEQPGRAGAATARVSLSQAIGVAEQESGGRARKAEMEREAGVDAYEVKTVAKGKAATVIVDAVSGKVMRVEAGGFLAGVFDAGDRRDEEAEFARLEASPMTLLQAIAAAERERGGRAVEAALKTQYGQTLFAVRIVEDFVPHDVVVDPDGGKVVPLPQSGRGEEE